jgi:hypothetical protein
LSAPAEEWCIFGAKNSRESANCLADCSPNEWDAIKEFMGECDHMSEIGSEAAGDTQIEQTDKEMVFCDFTEPYCIKETVFSDAACSAKMLGPFYWSPALSQDTTSCNLIALTGRYGMSWVQDGQLQSSSECSDNACVEDCKEVYNVPLGDQSACIGPYEIETGPYYIKLEGDIVSESPEDMAVPMIQPADAESCPGWVCDVPGQYCPEGAEGSNPGGYICCGTAWRDCASEEECRARGGTCAAGGSDPRTFNGEQGHDAAQCLENNTFDNDCCASPDSASCADGFSMVESDEVCWVNAAADWQAYSYSCVPSEDEEEPIDVAGGCDLPQDCVPSFKYYDVAYQGCTTVDTGGVGVTEPWCATRTDDEGGYVIGSNDFAWCPADCNVGENEGEGEDAWWKDWWKDTKQQWGGGSESRPWKEEDGKDGKEHWTHDDKEAWKEGIQAEHEQEKQWKKEARENWREVHREKHQQNQMEDGDREGGGDPNTTEPCGCEQDGAFFCNFDDGESGFCEPCRHFDIGA